MPTFSRRCNGGSALAWSSALWLVQIGVDRGQERSSADWADHQGGDIHVCPVPSRANSIGARAA